MTRGHAPRQVDRLSTTGSLAAVELADDGEAAAQRCGQLERKLEQETAKLSVCRGALGRGLEPSRWCQAGIPI
jgi:hypothetical protein